MSVSRTRTHLVCRRDSENLSQCLSTDRPPVNAASSLGVLYPPSLHQGENRIRPEKRFE
jgi:hypothetical protein